MPDVEDKTEEQKAEAPQEPQKEDGPEPFKAFATKEEYETHLEHVTKERLERKDRKAKEQQAEAERKAREDALKEQEDWKRLAEERTNTITEKDNRIAELESVEGERDTARERLTALEDRLKGLIKPQLEAVPELYRPFVESMTVEEQAEWLSENAEKLGTQHGPGRDRPAGSRPTGRAQQVPNNETDKEARERQRLARVSAI